MIRPETSSGEPGIPMMRARRDQRLTRSGSDQGPTHSRVPLKALMNDASRTLTNTCVTPAGTVRSHVSAPASAGRQFYWSAVGAAPKRT